MERSGSHEQQPKGTARGSVALLLPKSCDQRVLGWGSPIPGLSVLSCCQCTNTNEALYQARDRGLTEERLEHLPS